MVCISIAICQYIFIYMDLCRYIYIHINVIVTLYILKKILWKVVFHSSPMVSPQPRLSSFEPHGRDAV